MSPFRTQPPNITFPLIVALIAQPNLFAQEKESPGGTYEAITVSNPEIPLEHLKVLVRPLPQAELVVEADAWLNLVKEQAKQLALRRIDAQSRKDDAEDSSIDTSTEDSSTEATQVVQVESQPQDGGELVESLLELQEKRSNLLERLEIVVQGLEAKGGEVETYNKYMKAVRGIDLEVTNAATFWTLMMAWLTSEQGGLRWLWNFLQFIAILVVFYSAASMVAGLVRRAAAKVTDISQLLINFLGSFVKQAVLIIGVIVALAALEINIAPLLAAIGAAGFVVGFALQDTLSNFASGLMILAYRPFDVGDVVTAGGASGLVESVTLFSTHIRTFDNQMMIVPNNDIWGNTITNSTANATRRVDLVFEIGYCDDEEQAKSLLERICREHTLVLNDPAPVVQLHELSNSTVKFVCRPWVRTSDFWTVYWDMISTVKAEFSRAGMSAPIPQRGIHVYHEAASAPTKVGDADHFDSSASASG